MGTAPAPKSASTSPTAHDTHEGDNVRKAPRKLNRSANQLHRNQACLTCRRRRIKCDAGRPHCSSCVRSFRFLARTQPDPERDAGGVQCVYEHGEPPEAEPEGEEDPRLAVAKLEARVAELQGALNRLTSTSPTSSTFPGILPLTQPKAGHSALQQTTPPPVHPTPPQTQQPTPPQQPPLFIQTNGMVWPNLDVNAAPGPQYTASMSYDASFPFGATGAAPPITGGVPSVGNSPVSVNLYRLSWPLPVGLLEDGNAIDALDSRVVGDAMTRYVEMSMGGMGPLSSSNQAYAEPDLRARE